MFQIDTKSNIPIFEQLISMISKYIALDILKPEEKLPSVRQLAKELGINPNTVSKAYQECEILGLIYSQAGVGSFVSPRNESITSLKQQVYEDLDSVIKRLEDLGESRRNIISYIQEDIQ